MPILFLTSRVRAEAYSAYLLEANLHNDFLFAPRGSRFFWLRKKGTAVFGFEPKLTGKKKFVPKLSVRTPDSRGKCGFEVKFRKKNRSQI